MTFLFARFSICKNKFLWKNHSQQNQIIVERPLTAISVHQTGDAFSSRCRLINFLLSDERNHAGNSFLSMKILKYMNDHRIYVHNLKAVAKRKLKKYDISYIHFQIKILICFSLRYASHSTLHSKSLLF